MNTYRMSDQYYEEEYDRETIRQLKELEKSIGVDPESVWCDGRNLKEFHDKTIHLYPYDDAGIRRARNRSQAIAERKLQDANKDRLVQQVRVPHVVKCTCGTRMIFNGYVFDFKTIPVLLVFDCPRDEKRKLLYPDGDEYVQRRRKCDSCGGEIKRATERKGKTIVCTDVCLSCSKTTTVGFEIPNDESEQPITKEDRKKYCIDFTHRKTRLEELEAVQGFFDLARRTTEQKNIKEHYSVDKIERLTIPQLENLISKSLEKEGFVKLQFEKPEMKQIFVVPFSIQDASDRPKDESLKLLSKRIKATLFHSNWRLRKD